MRKAAMDGFWVLTPPLEGTCYWMYLDILGLVTTGIGNLVDSAGAAAMLPWKKPDGTRASFKEIVAEWNYVKSLKDKAHMGGGAFKNFTKLRLSHEDVVSLVNKVASGKVDTMKRRFASDFDEWPADAQLATLSMAWAVGAALDTKFPKLVAALKAKDWIRASNECHINTDGADRVPGTADDNRGVIPRNRANKIMYRNAYKVAVGGFIDRELDPDVLYWPQELDPVPLDMDDVHDQQRALARLGYYEGKIDGAFGKLSKAATIAFQRDQGLEQVGKIGPKTKAALAAEIARLEAEAS